MSEPLHHKIHTQTQSSPETRLWASVLLTWLWDIQTDYHLWRDSLNGHRAEYAMRLSDHRNHLDHQWSKFLCAMAGIDHDGFKEKVIGVIEGREKLDLVTIRY